MAARPGESCQGAGARGGEGDGVRPPPWGGAAAGRSRRRGAACCEDAVAAAAADDGVALRRWDFAGDFGKAPLERAVAAAVAAGQEFRGSVEAQLHMESWPWPSGEDLSAESGCYRQREDLAVGEDWSCCAENVGFGLEGFRLVVAAVAAVAVVAAAADEENELPPSSD